jgi:5-formyltetrahydrofolate cyclo-ligase
MNEKIRKELMALRLALAEGEVERLSTRVVDRFFKLSGLTSQKLDGRKVALYQAMPSELTLAPLEKRLAPPYYFPRIFDRAAREIEFVEAQSDSPQSWQEGPYGIQEPHPELTAIAPGELELIFVPGVAFGLHGERVGMGGGYYDRFLARVPDAIRVGLAFDFQLQERLEQNPWDQPMDWIVTESREYRGPRVQHWLESL